MAENKKVQIKNTGGDALYPRTAAENIVNVPGGTMNVFMYLNGYGNENQFPDPYKGDRYFDSAAHKVYECVTATTWTGKKEVPRGIRIHCSSGTATSGSTRTARRDPWLLSCVPL